MPIDGFRFCLVEDFAMAVKILMPDLEDLTPKITKLIVSKPDLANTKH